MTGWKKPALAAVAALALTATPVATRAAEGGDQRGDAPPSRSQVTDREVSAALAKGKEYLIGIQNPDGSFGKGLEGDSLLVFMTLAYMGMHPNHEVMGKGLKHALDVQADTDLDGGAGSHKSRGYSLPIRTMGLSYVHNKLLGENRGLVRQKMSEDILRYQLGQQKDGGWRYALDPAKDYDFSVSQWPILAMRDASLVGIEIPLEPLRKAQKLYYANQQDDGGWTYQEKKGDSYGSMTAAGVASVYIIADLLEPGSGCPCSGGRSARTESEADRRIDAGLAWLSKNFDPRRNPNKNGHNLYWLYCVERVGIAAGYKYFGDHNWYTEGAEILCKAQKPDGSWGNLNDTCFAMLFLFKGRAPVLFNKLKFDTGGREGEWNMHRRDIANLTHYIERTKEQMFHWQIVDLRAPPQELHDAPILYISAESIPDLTDEEKAKLRAFTDTGGTILFEASCGNPTVRRWFTDFAADLWPEWPLKKLDRDHPVWSSVYEIATPPEMMGVTDSLRTRVFFSADDISCPWHVKAFAAKGYLFNWGINLLTYATDGAPLRAKLSGNTFEEAERYTSPITAGAKKSLRIARVKHPGDWQAGASYKPLETLAGLVKAAVDVDLETGEGVAPDALAGYDAALVAGTKPMTLSAGEADALKSYATDGGFLWFEAVDGSPEFYTSAQQAVKAMGFEMKLLPQTAPIMSGRMQGALGYSIASGVEFRRALRVKRLGRGYAELWGIFNGGKLVGVVSPIDTLFSLTGYEAYRCMGYKAPDARAVATNIVLELTTR